MYGSVALTELRPRKGNGFDYDLSAWGEAWNAPVPPLLVKRYHCRPIVLQPVKIEAEKRMAAPGYAKPHGAKRGRSRVRYAALEAGGIVLGINAVFYLSGVPDAVGQTSLGFALGAAVAWLACRLHRRTDRDG
jgi:hypothetical protein